MHILLKIHKIVACQKDTGQHPDCDPHNSWARLIVQLKLKRMLKWGRNQVRIELGILQQDGEREEPWSERRLAKW